MAANAKRGEHELQLGRRKYRLRPSHEAIDAIEEATGHSLLALIRLGNAAELKVKQLGVIGAELIRAGADAKDDLTRGVDPDKIGEMIFEQGIPAATARLTLCLLDAATGGRKVTGEAKPVAETSGSTTGD